MKTFRKKILTHLIELIIVAFGVFLGIYVSEWKSAERMQKNTFKSLNYIIAELEANHENLGRAIEYHVTIKANLKKITSQLDETTFDKPYFGNKEFHVMKIDQWTGVGLPDFKTISYDGAKLNGIFQEIDFEIVQLIASAYKQITFSQEFGKSILDKLLQSNSSTKVADIVGTVELLTSDVLNNEHRVASELKNIIKELKAYEASQSP